MFIVMVNVHGGMPYSGVCHKTENEAKTELRKVHAEVLADGLSAYIENADDMMTVMRAF